MDRIIQNSNLSMNILLIDPTVGTGDGLNTGLGWLASSVDKAGHGVRVLDLVNRPYLPIEEAVMLIRETIIRLNPDIIGFCIHSITLSVTKEMVGAIRTFFKGYVVIGGPQMAFECKNIFDKISEIDFAVVGEAEDTLPELLNLLDKKEEDFRNIDGLIWQDNGIIIENKARVPRIDLDTLPSPDYKKHFGLQSIKVHYPLMTSRGCPYSCSFCNSNMSGKRWRKRSLGNVIGELKDAIARYDIKEFMVQEPVFNLEPERVMDFCNLLIRESINLPWFIPSGVRADRLTSETIEAMKNAGCTELKIGVETLVPEVFPSVNKGTTLGTIISACKMVKKSSFPLRGSFIIGLPGDNYANSLKNYKLSRKLGFKTTDWSLLIPYPGTKIYEWVMKNGKMFYDYCSADQGSFQVTSPRDVKLSFETSDFPGEDRIKAFVTISVKSGNYIFDRTQKSYAIMISLLKQILRYDPLNFFWHIKNIYNRLKLREKRGASKSERYVFSPLSPFWQP